jgi:hypothetical protein
MGEIIFQTKLQNFRCALYRVSGDLPILILKLCVRQRNIYNFLKFRYPILSEKLYVSQR